MKTAIFGIDGTLIQGNSERLFSRFLLRRGHLGIRQLLGYLLFFIRYWPIGGIRTGRKNKAYLCGLSVEGVDGLAEEFVNEQLSRFFFEPALQRLRQHKNRGHRIVLLSSTLECIARALGHRLNVDYVCATVCAQRNGVYLAQPPEVHPFDSAKLSLASRMADQYGSDLSQVVAYGHSGHDLFLLASVGEAVAVRPDSRLSRVAASMGWEVVAEPPLPAPLPS